MKRRFLGNTSVFPLQINTIKVAAFPGVIGISSCPGMKYYAAEDSSTDTMECDFQSIITWGASAIVTLLENHEMVKLGAGALPERISSIKHCKWMHLPINDMRLPDDEFELKWQTTGPLLLKLLQEGKRILIHCKQGVGRSGIVAARLLIESGIEIDKAIKVVRKATPGSLMLYSHEEYCYALESDICAYKAPG